jgi:S1-C subfamily serine protease
LKRLVAAVLIALLAACASPAPPAPEDSLVPGTVGVLVRDNAGAVLVSAVRPGSAAAAAGVQPGDQVEKLNGAPVASAREFYRRVLDIPPGSVVKLELRRGERLEAIELPVRQIDITPRA